MKIISLNRNLIKSCVFLVLVFQVFVLISFNQGFAQDNITWLETDFPPCFILKGQYKEMGYEDIITDILEENLKGYDFQKRIANTARIYHEMKQGRKVCHVAYYKTPEREKFMYFSIPNTLTFPVVLITTRDKARYFGNKELISLEETLKNKKLKLVIAKNRSYGAPLDRILERYRDHKNVYIHSGQDIAESLFNMLLKDRIDYSLGLPEELIYWSKIMEIEDRIEIFHLKENQEHIQSWFGYVACSKTKWGKKTIKNINKVLKEQRPTPRYRRAYERWIDEQSITRYRKLYTKYFLTAND